MVVLKILALVDIHTLLVWMFYSVLPDSFVFTGATFSFTKGLIFFLPSKNLFSFLDMLIGIFIIFLIFFSLPNIIWWSVFFFLLYKIAMSLSIF